jgi:hypothetical protein
MHTSWSMDFHQDKKKKMHISIIAKHYIFQKYFYMSNNKVNKFDNIIKLHKHAWNFKHVDWMINFKTSVLLNICLLANSKCKSQQQYPDRTKGSKIKQLDDRRDHMYTSNTQFLENLNSHCNFLYWIMLWMQNLVDFLKAGCINSNILYHANQFT